MCIVESFREYPASHHYHSLLDVVVKLCKYNESNAFIYFGLRQDRRFLHFGGPLYPDYCLTLITHSGNIKALAHTHLIVFHMSPPYIYTPA